MNFARKLLQKIFQRPKTNNKKLIMPLYEYKCNSCEAEFEMLRWLTDRDDDVTCPKCGEKQAERKISAAACTTPAGSGAFKPAACTPFS